MESLNIERNYKRIMLNKLYILTIFFSLVTLKRNKGKLFKTTSPVDPE